MRAHLRLPWAAATVLALAADAATRPPQGPPAGPEKVELSTAEVAVPLRWFGDKPVVDVKINGAGPYGFFLDTGAQGTVLGLDLAGELKLPFQGEVMVGSPGGRGLPGKQVRLARVEVGGAAVTGMPAVAFDRSRLYRGKDAPRGVLSASTFPGYLLTLDYPGRRAVLRKGELPAPDGKTVFGYDGTRPLPEVRLALAGREVEVFLDTGAPSSIVLPLSYAERLPLASKPVEVGRGRRVDREVVFYGAKLKGQARLGGFVFDDPDIRFDDAPGAHGLVGNGLLRSFAVTLDSKNRRVRLEKQTAEPEAGRVNPAKSP